MNANELADALQETEPYYSTDYKLFDKAATMLRQQQTEIEALKQSKADGNNKVNSELTDEEITFIWESCDLCGGLDDAIDFARAILRKAEEK